MLIVGPETHGSTVPTAYLPRRGPFAAGADNLGRVLLINTATVNVVRVWKGYRDAQLAWLLARPPHQQPQATAGEGSGVPPASKFGAHPSGLPRQLLLVVLAPLRQVVEVWQVRCG